MKARKVDLGRLRPEYDVEGTLRVVLMGPQQRLSGMGLMRRMELWEDVMGQLKKGTSVLVEQGEWEELKRAMDGVEGFGADDFEFVRAILQAPEVEVKENEGVD